MIPAIADNFLVAVAHNNEMWLPNLSSLFLGVSLSYFSILTQSQFRPIFGQSCGQPQANDTNQKSFSCNSSGTSE